MMLDYRFFIKSNTLEGLGQATWRDRPVQARFDDVVEKLVDRQGVEAAQLFAKPFLSPDREGLPPAVSWYAAVDGSVVRWSDLDLDERERSMWLVRHAIEALDPFLADPNLGALLERWLNVADIRQDLLVVGGQPVLTNWGMLPKAAASDEDARGRHFREGLGLLLARSATPAFMADDAGDYAHRYAPAARGPAQDAVPPEPPAARVPYGAAPAAAASQVPTASAVSVAVVAAKRRPAWMLPAILSGVAAAVLVLLLLCALFGLLAIRPSEPQIAATSEAETITTLEERVGALRADLAQNVCRIDTSPGTVEGAANAQATVTPAPTPAATTLVPPPPTQAALQSPGSGSENAGSVVQAAEDATVLVLVKGVDGVSQGTGFFISSDRIVTNLHVIGSAEASDILVTNRRLGRAIPARVVATSAANASIGSADFAVLAVEGGVGGQGLAIATSVAKGESVVAAGFPGVVLETDGGFQRLLEGDTQASPEMSVTQGIITTFQTGDNDLKLALHTAAISPGNSGGPLLDYCGRVVGVNTFQRSGSEQNIPLSFAQLGAAAEKFLTQATVPFRLEAGACQPQRVAQDDAAPAPLPPAAATGATP